MTYPPHRHLRSASGDGDELGVSLSVVTPWWNIRGKGFLMLHHLAGGIIQVANLVIIIVIPLRMSVKHFMWCRNLTRSAVKNRTISSLLLWFRYIYTCTCTKLDVNIFYLPCLFHWTIEKGENIVKKTVCDENSLICWK